MIARSVGMAGAALMLGACAVSMPPEYLGIATGVPVPPEDRARIDAAAAADDPRTRDACLWPRPADGTLASVPCALLPVSQLASQAWSGNKPAALELGKRFEAGRGVPQDFDKALSLYRQAAMSTPGEKHFVFLPPVNGQSVPFSAPPDPGLPEARRRIALLETWRERRDRPEASSCPAPPVALAGLAARPETAPERARLDKAIADDRLGRGRCFWQKDERSLTVIPCEVVPLPTLARLAGAGDRRAMLELGQRFEHGRGVAADLVQAEALYCAAGETRITGGGFTPENGGRWSELRGEIGLEDARRRWERLRRARGAQGPEGAGF